MKLLLLIGILVCVLLVYIIYKNSKGVDVLDNFYNVIENYSDLHNNKEGTPLDNVDMQKMGDPTNQYSTMNNQTAYLAGGGNKKTKPPDKPKDKLSQEQRNELKNYLVKSDKITETEVDEKLGDRISDPGGFFDGNVQARSFIEVEKRGLADEPAFRKGEPKADVNFDKAGEKELDAGKKAGEEVDEEDNRKKAEDKAASDAMKKQMKSINPTSEGDYEQTQIGSKISKCNQITSCSELTGKDCGYCADDGFSKSYFGIGSNKGPLTAVCKPGKWTTQKSKCMELKDKEKCALANDDCANIPEEHKGLCGYCPSTGKVMPYKVIGGNKMVKYNSDSCNYDWKAANVKGPILVDEECLKFSKNNPCITPYHATGPHKQSCLADLWKKSGCDGEKPFMRKFPELTADTKFNSGNYKLIKAKMDKQKKDMNSDDIGTVMRSTMNCTNKEATINPCEYKYYGGSYDPRKHKVAREYCRRRLWKESGCGEDGHKNPDLLKGAELNKATMMTTKQYTDSIIKLPEIANTPVPPARHNIRKQASLDCYGREPPAPSPLKPGFFVKYDKIPGLKLWGYLMEMNNMANWRVMWVAKESSSGRMNRKDYIVKGNQSKQEQTNRLNVQRQQFGWPGYKNAEDPRMKNLPDYIGSQFLTVVEKCEPGVTMCGNSCMGILSNLKDNYPTPQDCVVSEWGGWSVCNKECKEQGTPGIQTRARYVLEQAKRGGISCPPNKVNGKPNPYYYDTKQCVQDVECYNKNFNDESGELWDEDGRHKRGFVDAKGKRVTHVIISHSNYLHIQELEIYDETNTNVARTSKGGRASASDVGWGTYPNIMIDGNKDSGQRWPNSVHTHRGGNRWLRVNIRPTKVTRIIVYNRPDCCQNRLVGAKLIAWNGRRKVKEFPLNAQRKQVFHLWDKNVYNKCTRRGQVIKSCQELTVPMSYSEQEINTAKNIKFGGYDNATIMKDYGNGAYQVRLANGQLKNVPNNWIQSQSDNFIPNRREEFAVGDKVKVAKNDNGRRQAKDGDCMSRAFKKSETNPDGGDCDWHSYKWYGWGSRKWPVAKCAEKCLKNPRCNRFTFGKSNRWGGWGLGCRISTGGNGGFCPITTDRYKSNGWSWWGNSNYWGGDVYDKKGTKPVNAYKWIGDFQDKHKWNWYWGPKLGRGSRYAGRVAKWAPGNDAMACSYRCRNYKYFGLQGWGRCYCGNTLETGTQCHNVHHRNWHRWWSWYWPWGPRDCNKNNVRRAPSNLGRRAWYWYSWYGGYRTKVYKTPKGQISTGEQGWRHCSRQNQMCNPGRGATGLRKRYKRERSDSRNNYWYRCSSGSSYATYNANTLNRAQKRYANRWGAKRNYSCVHGCSGSCSRGGSGKLKGRAERIFAGYTAGRSTSSRPALIRYGKGNKWTTKGSKGSIRCDNTTFGNSYPGQWKTCQWKPA